MNVMAPSFRRWVYAVAFSLGLGCGLAVGCSTVPVPSVKKPADRAATARVAVDAARKACDYLEIADGLDAVLAASEITDKPHMPEVDPEVRRICETMKKLDSFFNPVPDAGDGGRSGDAD
jgi:hypothetical protein